MNALGRLKVAYRAWKLTGGSPLSPQYWVMKMLLGGRETASGENVDEQLALTYNAVWCCVDLISNTVGCLPLEIWEEHGDTRTPLPDDPAATTLRRPGRHLSPAILKKTLTAHVLTWGNGYAEIARTKTGRPGGLSIMLPNRTEPLIWDDRPRVADDGVRISEGDLVYRYEQKDGKKLYLTPAHVLHLRGLGFDGLKGYSVIKHAAETVGGGLGAEKLANRFFANDLHLGGILKYPGELKDKARANLQKSIEDRHAGADRAHRFLILEEGLDWIKTGIEPEAAQFLQSREFTVKEVARWYHMPLHMLAVLDKPSYASIEQFALEYVVYTVMPWLVMWEEETELKLLTDEPQKRAQFKIAALLRGDMKSRYEAYQIGRNSGWLSSNDIRRAEGMNPVPNGDDYLQPLNMVPLGQMPAQADKASPADKVPPAMRFLVLDAWRRVRSRERAALEKALNDPAALRRFPEEFYPKHADHARGLLMPLYVAAGIEPSDAQATVTALMERRATRVAEVIRASNGGAQKEVRALLAQEEEV
jgi:HK97 family phage portal protein